MRATLTLLCIQLYVFLWLTTARYPNLHQHPSEKQFLDPAMGKSSSFPDIGSPPELYLSLVMPAYKEEDRCEGVRGVWGGGCVCVCVKVSVHSVVL